MKKLSVRELQIVGSMTLLVVLGLVSLSSFSDENAPAVVEKADSVLSFPLDLNSACEKDLELLPGIGPAKAASIIEFREKNGPFTSVQALIKVKGIGEATLENLRPLVKVESFAEPDSKETGPQNGLIDINTATLEELLAIPGVGPSRAGAIIQYRELKGPFLYESDLLAVPGIGPAYLDLIREAAVPLAVKTNKGRVNINTASQGELESLPGIGPVIAARIIEYRNKQGAFESCQELLEIKGIGEKVLETFKELIEF